MVGARAAQQLHDSANGIDDTPVDTEVQEAKSYSAERTFAKDLSATKDIDRALFNVACIVAHRIRRDEFRASTVSVFIKYHDFTIAQKQCQMARPSATTAIILNEARRMVAEIWDGVTPLRQVGLGVSKLTHEPYEQLTLFEDLQMEYYRQWDRLYDEEKSQAEDARMLAFGRKVVQPAEIPPPRPSRRRSELKDNSLVFTYSDGEQALAAAKSAVKQNPTFRLYSKQQEDGTRYFVVVDEDGKAVERHFIEKRTNE